MNTQMCTLEINKLIYPNMYFISNKKIVLKEYLLIKIPIRIS